MEGRFRQGESLRIGGQGRHAPAVGGDGLSDVLQALDAQVGKGRRQLAVDAAPRDVGDDDAAGLSDLLQAGGDVHPVAKDVLLLVGDVAKMDADPQLDLLLARQRFLQRDGAGYGIGDGGEGYQPAVAHALHHLAAVPCHQRVEAVGPEFAQRSQGAGLVLTHQAGVACHIGGKDRRQSSRNVLSHI